MNGESTIDWVLTSPGDVSPRMRESWDGLNRQAAGGNPALDFRFVEGLVSVFGDGSERFAACRLADRVVAMAVVRPASAFAWELYMPSQACLSPLLIADDVDAALIMSKLFRRLPGFVASLRAQRIDPACQPFERLVEAGATDYSLYGRTYLIGTDGPFDEYWQRRSKGLRYKLRKFQKAVRNAGLEPSLTVASKSDQVLEAVRVHGRLESKGWKGDEGTAIRDDNDQGRFYRGVMRGFGDTGDAVAAVLRFDDEPVASLLCIGIDRRLVILKIAYDEDYAKFGPGRLCDYFFLEQLCNSGTHDEVEMYTRASPSDLSWATDSREWYDIELCRNRLLYTGLIAAKRCKSLIRSALRRGNPDGKQ